MLNRLLPPASQFMYAGSRVAPWLLGVVLFVKLGIALGAIFNGYYAASVADKIPIDAYAPEGTRAFVSLFASLGLAQLMFGLVGVAVLARYRALVPLFLLSLLGESVARKGISIALPIARTGDASGGVVNWAIFGVMLVAFALSMRRRELPEPPKA